jgi:hypothetical protein
MWIPCWSRSHSREALLVVSLDGPELLAERGVVREGLEAARRSRSEQPAAPDRLGDERGEAGFESATKRRGVTPFVTFVKRSG